MNPGTVNPGMQPLMLTGFAITLWVRPGGFGWHGGIPPVSLVDGHQLCVPNRARFDLLSHCGDDQNSPLKRWNQDHKFDAGGSK